MFTRLTTKLKERKKAKKDISKQIADACTTVREIAIRKMQKKVEELIHQLEKLQQDGFEERKRLEQAKSKQIEELSIEAHNKYERLKTQFEERYAELETSYHSDLKNANERLDKKHKVVQTLQDALVKKHRDFDGIMMKMVNAASIISDTHVDITKATARSSQFSKMLENISDQADRAIKSSTHILTAPLNRTDSSIKSLRKETYGKKETEKEDDRNTDDRAAS